jgi:hypothetical protein
LALMGLYVVMALLTAFIVLIFRKLLIILLVILAPLALVAWVTPGLDKYWTLWRTQFTKLLLMFPMIMGLLAAGRIFASITAGDSATMFRPLLGFAHLGPVPVPYVASVTSFADILIIIAAYFGPYFFLPQTYRWGGTAMGAIGKGVSQAVEKGANPAKDYLKWRQGLSPWKQSRAIRRAESERRIKHGYYERMAAPIDDTSLRGVIRGTRGRFTRGRLYGLGANEQIVQRATQHAQGELDKARREEIQQATIQLTQHDLPQYFQGDHDEIRRAIITGRTITVRDAEGNGAIQFNGAEYQQTHPHGLRAALDRGVIHGHWQEIEQLITDVRDHGTAAQRYEIQDFVDSNAQSISPAMTHLIKGLNVAAQSNPDDLVKMRGEEVESILGRLSHEIAAGGPGAVAAQQNLNIFLRNYATAAADTFRRGQLNQRGARAVRAFITGDAPIITDINVHPETGRVRPRTGVTLDPVEAAVAAPYAAAAAGTPLGDWRTAIETAFDTTGAAQS